MPYITVRQTPRSHQVTLDEILAGEVDLLRFAPPSNNYATATRTFYTPSLSSKLRLQAAPEKMAAWLDTFAERYAGLYTQPRQSLYHRFYIPKRSGGLREINAPLPTLMEALRELKLFIETGLPTPYHTSAFAYVRGRNTIDAVRRHQQNKSRWFLKLDFSDFFGSTTKTFVMEMMSKIYPFCTLFDRVEWQCALDKALDLCFLRGGLPQGTPISPTLTNLMMIPIDQKLNSVLREGHFVYTRYADDLLVSHRYKFDPERVQRDISSVLTSFSAPFRIKPEKTRYGSSSGSNWNLGVMLNKDNEITIGHKKKRNFKAMLDSYIRSKKGLADAWELGDVQVLGGLISYYCMVEKESIEAIIKNYNERFSVDIRAMIKRDISAA